MTLKKRSMPIGIQTFEKIRTANYAYVDKTTFVYKLANEEKPYFLSRPRRFGKSLFLSTLEAYFTGKKELFTGLALENLEEAGAKEENRDSWQVYPIFRFDFNAKRYDQVDGLTNTLDFKLCELEAVYGKDENAKDSSERLQSLLKKAHAQTGKKVVILVDEYDKPLLESLEYPEIFEDNRKTMKAFFSNLKSEDEHIRFAFLTGVTKFAQVSVFSDLNNLNDISMDEEFSAICGISEKELLANFDKEIKELAHANELTQDECIAKLKKTYDGYHFSENSEGVYNPFSLINTFEKKMFRYYWFQTGTPTFLIKGLEHNRFDVRQLTDGFSAPSSFFSEYRYENKNIIPLLYQAGYLTIKEYDSRFSSYILMYPNEEVKYGFLNNLLPINTSINKGEEAFFIQNFVRDIESCKVDDFMTRLQAILSSVPYNTYGEKSVVTEQTFQIGIYLVFQLMGQFTQCEVHSSKGRADCVVWTKDAIYVFEFKLNGTKEEALQQIDDKSYAVPYQADGRKIVKIGVGFEKEAPIIKDWVVA